MKEIPLTQGKVALVDDDMYEYLSQWKWQFVSGYAVRTSYDGGAKRKVSMHRVVMNEPEGKEVDHRNSDKKTDNRRENLRVCTHKQNTMNQSVRSDNSSGYKGVWWHKNMKKFQANIGAQNKRFFLGTFESAEMAARAYDAKAVELHGEFARLNFPITK